MSRHIHVIAQRHDPVVMNRLVRLLIAQAALERQQQEQEPSEDEAKVASPKPRREKRAS